MKSWLSTVMQGAFFLVLLVTLAARGGRAYSPLYIRNDAGVPMPYVIDRDSSTSEVLSLFENNEPPSSFTDDDDAAANKKAPPPATGGAKRGPTLEEINQAMSQQHMQPIENSVNPADVMFGDAMNGAENAENQSPMYLVNRRRPDNDARAHGRQQNAVSINAAAQLRPQIQDRQAPIAPGIAAAGSSNTAPASAGREGEDSLTRRRRILSRQRTRRNRNNPRVSEGHRLITRALWRIFDALMEKNENAAITDRVNIMENGIRQVMAKMDGIQGQIDDIQAQFGSQDQTLTELSLGLHDVKMISEKVQSLEDWKNYFAGAQNDDVSHLIGPGPVYTECPPPFTTVNGECFYMVDSAKKSWHDARRECAKFGADLAAPNNVDSLREYLKDLQHMPEYVWVGAMKQGNGDWVWLGRDHEEGKKVDMSMKTWNDDLPAGLGNCMGLYEYANYRAYDYNCTEEDFYVCQYHL